MVIIDAENPDCEVLPEEKPLKITLELEAQTIAEMRGVLMFIAQSIETILGVETVQMDPSDKRLH